MRNPGIPEGELAEVNGASLYYDVAGNGEPLVLVHAGSPTAGCGTGSSRRSANATA